MRLSNIVRSRPRLRKGLIAGLAVFVFLILFCFIALPPILKPYAQRMLSETLHRKVTIQQIQVNPLALSVKVRGVEISEREAPGTFISVGEIYGSVSLSSVFRGGLVIGEAHVARPYVNVVRNKDGTYNFSDLIDEFSKETPKKPEPVKEKEPFRFSLNNIQIMNGSIDFNDGPKSTRHEVRAMEVSVPFISNMKYFTGHYVQPSFSATVNGRIVALKGKARPFHESLETSLNLSVDNLDISYYLEYVPFKRDYEVPSAFLDVKTVISFTQYKDRQQPTLRVEGDVTLRELRVTGKDKSHIASLPMLKVVIAPSDLLAMDISLAAIQIQNPDINVAIDREGKLNLLALIPRTEPENAGAADKPKDKVDKAKDKKDEKTRFSVASIRLSGGKVRFADDSRGEPFVTSLRQLRVDVDGLELESAKKADFLVSLMTEAEESVEIKGKVALSPLASDGTVTVLKLALRKYAPYYFDAVRFDIRSGTLDINLGYHFAQVKGQNEIRLNDLGVTIADLKMRQREESEDFLKIPVLSVKDADIALGENTITVGEFATGKGEVFIRRSEKGEMNVTRLVPPARPAAPKKAAAKKTPEKPWTITIKKINVDQYAVQVLDRTTKPAAKISLNKLKLQAENLTTIKNSRSKFDFATNYGGTGSLSLTGSFSADPAAAAVRIRARTLPIGPVTPYFAKRVKVAITGGAISIDGNATVSAPASKPLRGSFKGEMGISKFSSLDKGAGEDFLKFASLHLGGIDIAYNPTSVVVKEISLTDFYSRIILNSDATLNLQGLVISEEPMAEDGVAKANAGPTQGQPAQAPAQAALPAATEQAIPIRIDTITLLGGSINFSDRYIKPNYSASLAEMGGRISGLSSEKDKQADVELRGKLENSAPLEILGKINPLTKDLFLDLTVSFKDWDLPPLSPYSGRYAGYAIQKGKLGMNLKYHIENRKLSSENKVFLDQFTFGEKVDSPDATKLPVKFAVSLLKDRSGAIRLDLPVGGTIDDPKFNVWAVVWQVVENVLVKAATAPFELLASLFKGGPDLSYLEFEPGSATVSTTEKVKLNNLEKALYDRPALNLEIEGYVDLDRDKEGIKQATLKRKLAAVKAEHLAKSGEKVPDLDTITIDPAEYPKYLARIYKREKFPKPRNAIGMEKELPPSEMEKLILTNMKIDNDALLELAKQRAVSAQEHIIASGKVEAGRIFLVKAKTLQPEHKDNQKDSRVIFKLK